MDIAQILGSVVDRKYFKDYFIQGGKEHVRRTLGQRYMDADLDAKIGMVKAELDKIPDPDPNHIGFASFGEFYWPRRAWADELKVRKT